MIDDAGTFSGSKGTDRREGSGPLELAYLNLVKLDQGTVVNGRYRLEKLIGQGGFGIVFEALDQTLNSRVAVKFLNPRLVKNEQKFLRVKREINLSRKISDARIIKIFSLESWQGIHFLVMELAGGRSLKSWLQDKGRYAWPEFREIFLQILEAVEVLHRSGIVHRDLKPANILIGENHAVKILDFGLAKEVDDMDKTSTVGEIVGSPFYMSPEQIRGQGVDFQSDVYQLGLILYRTLSGRHPFDHTSTMEVIFRQLNQRPERITGLAGGLPRFLRFGLEKALEKPKARRFRDAGAMARFFRKEKMSGLGKLLADVWRRPLRWALAVLLLAAVAFPAYRATFGSRAIHALDNDGSRVAAWNRFGVRLWSKDFAPFIVYLAYPTRSELPASLGSGSNSLDLRKRLGDRPLVMVLLSLPEQLVFPSERSITCPDLFCQRVILGQGGEILYRAPFLSEHEYEAYDYIRVVKPNTVKLLGENAKGEREALISLQQFQSMYPFAMVYQRGVKKYVFTHPGTFEVFPQPSADNLSVFMLFGVNNLFAHMTFVAEIGFHRADGDDKIIKGIPNIFPDLRTNIPFEDKLFILPAGGHLVTNRWHDQGWARFNEDAQGNVLDLDRSGRLTLRTKNKTFSYWDSPDTLRRVYTLVNSSYQERMKKHNLGHALDLVRQALAFPLQNPYLRSALLYFQGDLEVRLGRYAAAEQSLLQAMESYPGNNDASERLCEMDMLRNDPQAALLRLAGAVSDSSEFWGFSSFGVQLFKGYVFLHMGMFSKAGDEFEKIRVNLPGLATMCQATNDLFKGDYRAALAAARGLEKKPLETIDLRELRLLLGRALLLDYTDYKRAKFLFDDIFRNSLESGHLAEISTYYLLAREGRTAEARQNASEAFTRLQARARGDFMTRLWLFYDAYVYGLTMELAGDRAEAARGHRACIEANPHTELAARSRRRLALLRRRS